MSCRTLEQKSSWPKKARSISQLGSTPWRYVTRFAATLGVLIAVAVSVNGTSALAQSDDLFLTSDCSRLQTGSLTAAGFKPLSMCSFANPNRQNPGGQSYLVGSGETCEKAYVDAQGATAFGDENIDAIRVAAGGTLVFVDPGESGPDFKLSLSSILVRGEIAASAVERGELIVGTLNCPIEGTIELEFYDNGAPTDAPPVTSSRDGTANKDFAPCGEKADASGNCPNSFGRKVLGVGPAGVISLHGAHGVPETPQGVSWTYLSQIAKAGEAEIHLENPVDWRAGDWIVIATTDFSSHHSEIVQIKSPMGTDGQSFQLEQSLVHNHFGGVGPGRSVKNNRAFQPRREPSQFTDNFGVDERAEVGLLTRSVRLTSKINPSFPHIGGHLMIRRYFEEVSIEGVEFQQFGQGGNMGRYPIHFHLARDTNCAGRCKNEKDLDPSTFPVPSETLIEDNSIHHSYLRCITLHATNYVTLEDNVCARIIGHAVYLEDGLEWKNEIDNNLVVGVMQAEFTPAADGFDEFWAGDFWAEQPENSSYNGTNVKKIITSDALTPTAFWIRSPDNVFTNNSVAGCQGLGKGFWYITSKCASGEARKWYPQDSLNYFPQLTEAGTFDDNRAHGCYVGLDTSTENTVLSDGINDNGSPFLSRCSTGPGPIPNAYVNYQPRNLDLLPGNPPKKSLDMEDLATSGICEPVPVTGTPTKQKDCQVLPLNFGKSVVTTFEDMTVTRNRFRGIWVRPGWYDLHQAAVAQNLYGASVVSSGSADGSPPGIWGAVTDSLFVGRTNNVFEPFGPASSTAECMNYPTCANEGGKNSGVGYPEPKLQQFGFMFYDGPARLENNKFVNFQKTMPPNYNNFTKPPESDGRTRFSSDEEAFIEGRSPFKYQGDAAMGWFQANQNTFPGTQYTEGNVWDNVDFRHMIYTVLTGPLENGAVLDGDLNTVIQDRDGTLTGYEVEGSDGNTYPFVLNNIPFNESPTTDFECHSDGAFDTEDSLGLLMKGLSDIPVSAGLVSPHDHATLVLNYLNPAGAGPFNNKYFPVPDSILTPHVRYNDEQDFNGVTFMKDQDPHLDPDNDGLSEFPLITQQALRDEISFRKPMIATVPENSRQVIKITIPGTPTYGLYMKGRVNFASKQSSNFEPKVRNLLGYTVHFPNYATPQSMSFGLMDVVNTKVETKPFNIRVGVCYSKLISPTADADPFEIKRGRFPFGAPFRTLADPDLWNNCRNEGDPGCPRNMKMRADFKAVASLAELKTANDQRQVNLAMALMNGDSTDSIDNANFYYFDKTTGVVFFYVDQYLPTVRTDKTMKISGFTPEGTCDINGNDIDRKDVAKPGAGEACTQAEELYTCPAAGCPYYVVTVRDPNYATTSPEVPSICDLAYSADKSTTAWQPYPETTDRLLRSGATGGNNELCPITTTRAAK